jgi:hypothetical protein
MGAYDAYFASQLQDYIYPREAIEAALKDLPHCSGWEIGCHRVDGPSVALANVGPDGLDTAAGRA